MGGDPGGLPLIEGKAADRRKCWWMLLGAIECGWVRGAPRSGGGARRADSHFSSDYLSLLQDCWRMGCRGRRDGLADYGSASARRAGIGGGRGKMDRATSMFPSGGRVRPSNYKARRKAREPPPSARRVTESTAARSRALSLCTRPKPLHRRSGSKAQAQSRLWGAKLTERR
jgi:hypothetical protein